MIIKTNICNNTNTPEIIIRYFALFSPDFKDFIPKIIASKKRKVDKIIKGRKDNVHDEPKGHIGDT